MIADHVMKMDGKWYKAGETIEESSADATVIQYTKTDITRMSIADMRAVAAENGIENADTMNKNELKPQLISVLGL